MLCIKNGHIHTAVSKEVFTGDILVDQGKIVEIGPKLAAGTAEIIDAQGLDVYPGFVDAHCHVGLDVMGAGTAGADYNEKTNPVTPQLRGIDGFNPFDPHIAFAVKGGVTCICTGPGSANAIGGTFTTIKTYGKRVDKMVVKDPVAMKCAFGENPKRCYQTTSIASRMENAALIREALAKAKLYQKKLAAAGDDLSKYPAYDDKCEALLPVLHKEIPLKAHAHQANDIFTALRIAKEFDVRMTLEHVTEGHMIVDELAQEPVMLAIGPSFCSSAKYECRNRSMENAGILAAAGCHVSIITDAPVTPLEGLPLFAGMAIKCGMDPYEALKAITINPAEHAGIADRVGSLEVGKDGDFVLCEGSPFTLAGTIKFVIIDGRVIHKG